MTNRFVFNAPPNARSGPRGRIGLTLTETLLGLCATGVVLAFSVPILSQVSCDDGRRMSENNLRLLAGAHATYAADWNDRQFTLVRDDLGMAGGDLEKYNLELGEHPAIDLGENCKRVPESIDLDDSDWLNLVRPMVFEDGFSLDQRTGAFRMINVAAFNQYVKGHMFDETFYAPKDAQFLGDVTNESLTKIECEYAADEVTVELITSSSYILSPAAMFHPDVFASPSDGGYGDPNSLADGYRSPAVSEAVYPDQKTRMLENHWLQYNAVGCNPFGLDPTQECDPYFFNASERSVPVTLFYDGHVNHLSVSEASQSSNRTQQQSGFSLWTRDTPFGNDGYFSNIRHDGPATSYHVFTSGGIRGRDTLK